MTQISPPEMPDPAPERPGEGPAPQAGMPKWLIYGFAIKIAIVVAVVLGVMYAAGIFG